MKVQHAVLTRIVKWKQVGVYVNVLTVLLGHLTLVVKVHLAADNHQLLILYHPVSNICVRYVLRFNVLYVLTS